MRFAICRMCGRASARSNVTDEELAAYIGDRVMEDAKKLRLFMPDCFAKMPIEWDGHKYEVRVIYCGEAIDDR